MLRTAPQGPYRRVVPARRPGPRPRRRRPPTLQELEPRALLSAGPPGDGPPLPPTIAITYTPWATSQPGDGSPTPPPLASASLGDSTSVEGTTGPLVSFTTAGVPVPWPDPLAQALARAVAKVVEAGGTGPSDADLTSDLGDPNAMFVGPMAPASETPAGPTPSPPSTPPEGGGDSGEVSFGPGQPPLIGPMPPDEEGRVVSLAAADLEGDGRKEVLMADQQRDLILLQSGGARPIPLLQHADGLRAPGQIVLADLNGDGLLDLIVANPGGDNILVFPGLGGGRFGAEVNGGQGIPVGEDPDWVTVADLDGDGIPDLVVCDRGSDDVAILNGRGTGGDWTLVPGPRLSVGAGPAAAVVKDVNGDGQPDLLVSDSRANTVTLLPGLGGSFDDRHPVVYHVGQDPGPLFYGPFVRGTGMDLVTVNAGSDDLTLITSLDGARPKIRTISVGGLHPQAAFAVDPGNGVLDLVVASSGDGRISLLQGGDTLSLASTFVDPDLPHPTAMALSGAGGGQLSFFAATAERAAADLVSLNLGGALPPTVPESDFGPTPPRSPDADQLAAGLPAVALLLPLPGSSLDTVATLVAGAPDLQSAQDGADSPEVQAMPLITMLSPTVARPGQGAGQLGDDHGDLGDDEAAGEARDGGGPAAGALLSWARFVVGLDEAFEASRLDDPEPLAAVARLDLGATTRPRDEEPIDDPRPSASARDESLPAIDAGPPDSTGEPLSPVEAPAPPAVPVGVGSRSADGATPSPARRVGKGVAISTSLLLVVRLFAVLHLRHRPPRIGSSPSSGGPARAGRPPNVRPV
jgi:hypothetical protein